MAGCGRWGAADHPAKLIFPREEPSGSVVTRDTPVIGGISCDSLVFTTALSLGLCFVSSEDGMFSSLEPVLRCQEQRAFLYRHLQGRAEAESLLQFSRFG